MHKDLNNYLARRIREKMKKFKKMTEAHDFFIRKIQEKIVCPIPEDEFFKLTFNNCSSSDYCNVQDILDKLQVFSYAKFTGFLKRMFPKATEWQAKSLESIIKPWNILGWNGYSEYTDIKERTCQKYAVPNEDYEVICGCLVSCQNSADQFRLEMEAGLRDNRPIKKRWTDPTGSP